MLVSQVKPFGPVPEGLLRTSHHCGIGVNWTCSQVDLILITHRTINGFLSELFVLKSLTRSSVVQHQSLSSSFKISEKFQLVDLPSGKITSNVPEGRGSSQWPAPTCRSTRNVPMLILLYKVTCFYLQVITRCSEHVYKLQRFLSPPHITNLVTRN